MFTDVFFLLELTKWSLNILNTPSKLLPSGGIYCLAAAVIVCFFVFLSSAWEAFIQQLKQSK
jgi:VIT1/CCC1 family predicted Fe2+/Mn2+ transporter